MSDEFWDVVDKAPKGSVSSHAKQLVSSTVAEELLADGPRGEKA